MRALADSGFRDAWVEAAQGAPGFTSLGGIIRDVSFGYSVERYEVTPADKRADGGTLPLWRAVRWTPQEISFVPVPADPHAGTRSASHTRRMYGSCTTRSSGIGLRVAL